MGSTMEMSFNPDPTKQAILHSQQTSQRNYVGLLLSNNKVNLTICTFRNDIRFEIKLWQTFKFSFN